MRTLDLHSTENREHDYLDKSVGGVSESKISKARCFTKLSLQTMRTFEHFNMCRSIY